MMPSGLDAGFIFGLASPPAEFAHRQGAPWSQPVLDRKAHAARSKVSYQKMIRRLLDAYAAQYAARSRTGHSA
jgi:hypothetical protein